jgi:hypothetical protein
MWLSVASKQPQSLRSTKPASLTIIFLARYSCFTESRARGRHRVRTGDSTVLACFGFSSDWHRRWQKRASLLKQRAVSSAQHHTSPFQTIPRSQFNRKKNTQDQMPLSVAGTSRRLLRGGGRATCCFINAIVCDEIRAVSLQARQLSLSCQCLDAVCNLRHTREALQGDEICGQSGDVRTGYVLSVIYQRQRIVNRTHRGSGYGLGHAGTAGTSRIDTGTGDLVSGRKDVDHYEPSVVNPVQCQ